jgi:uncharacterized membrane protein YphA (DoxX/SURF4 family)
MKIAVRITQVLVGVLFIISGLVKANDPLGLAYKMEEYFDLWSTDFGAAGLFSALREQALPLSIFMITLEIGAGVALLLAWKKKFVLWLLLLLIIFFTFLTGYAYLSGKFTNCGCFGDCLPITPLTSFTKDIILLVLILFLLLGQRYMNPAGTGKSRAAILVASIVLTLALQWYVLLHLPLADCLPFRKGNNISQQMLPPPGSVPDSIAIRYIYEKNGKRFEFAPESLPPDFTTYKFIDRIDTVLRNGHAEPPIKGFVLKGAGGVDSAQAILQQPKAVLIFCMRLEQDSRWLNKLARTKFPVTPYIITSSTLENAVSALKSKGITGIPVFTCDYTIVKTAARTNPTIYYLEQGTVREKRGANEEW